MESTKNPQGVDSDDLGDRDFVYGPFASHRMPEGSHPGRLAHRAGGLAYAGKLVVIRAGQGRVGAFQKMAMASTQPVAGHRRLPRH